ncbi:hypothetical protein Mag101_06635 [Microbulbifer agarilyticus]|uniref:Uncharacterized protein n=1 Tax=Microbulbifer agarilyticus TaxID=260552 RepID=A0A1Q2M3W2_9GAMM|nr:RHS repeat protein [Microbulbifer agarilyticus]AQQ67346.1 hypothetical protein Mag101_06635 [Microbulbifer agarilyticus]
MFEANGDFPLTFSWHYNSFGNHLKSGAGYSVGSRTVADGTSEKLGETVVHTEQPLAESATPISLPLSSDPTQTYIGGATNNWRHNHSYFLGHYVLVDEVTERLISYRPDGSDLHFVADDGNFVGQGNRQWQVTKDLDGSQEHTGWTLKVGGRIERYDTAGRILRIENEQGQGITYTYDANGVQQESIADDNGNSITLGYAEGQLSQITRNDGSVYQFSYNANGLLGGITFPGANTPQRQFRYEDTRFPRALTGVTDEASNVYSTFAYDDEGRAVSSTHSDGANSGQVEYLSDTTRRLTNALGKQTTYTFAEVDGSKRIVSVQGEASANCAAANMAYTYDDNGFIASEADWEGNVTAYSRDSLGRELSRTEAYGTPDARTITTEWHVTLSVPVKIIAPEKVIENVYDASGRLMERKIIPVSN